MEQLSFPFSATVAPGDRLEIEHDGFKVAVIIHHDEDQPLPWVREDGHGPVCDWTYRPKRPGELVLSQEPMAHNVKRFYDFAEACKIARAENWGPPGDEGMTPRQKAAHAARADFNRLKAWCADEWSYVGLEVSVSRNGVQMTDEYAHALWGVETDSGADYFAEIAGDLAGQALAAARAKLAQLAGMQTVGHIDLGVTWAGVAQLVALGLENGTDEGKRQAREHLDRMAATLAAVQPLLTRCADFLAGFEDDATQEPHVTALLAQLRAVKGED